MKQQFEINFSNLDKKQKERVKSLMQSHPVDIEIIKNKNKTQKHRHSKSQIINTKKLRSTSPNNLDKSYTHKSHHQCKEVFLKNKSPYKKSTKKLPSRPNFMQRSKSQKIFSNAFVSNQNKISQMQEYQIHFSKRNFQTMLVVPILMNFKSLVIKIEHFYNLLAKDIMTKKKLNQINMANIIDSNIVSNNQKSKIVFEQNLMDLLYSVKKYRKKDEINIFYEMITKGCSNLKIVYYLYFRQIFKLITANFFINDKTIETNPLNLQMSKNKALEIIQESLFNYPNLIIDFEGSFYQHFKNKQIKYYELMNFLWYSQCFKEDQNFIEDFAALYDFKNKPDIYKNNFKKNAEQTSKNIVKTKILESEYDYYLSQAKNFQRKMRKDANNYDDQDQFKQNLEEELDTRIRANTQRRQQQVESKYMDFAFEGRNQKIIQNDLKKSRNLIYSENVFDNDFNSNKKSKIKQDLLHSNEVKNSMNLSQSISVIDKKESINRLLKNILKEELKLVIEKFIQNSNFSLTHQEALKQSFFEMFFSKLLKVLSMIYISKEQKFFQLIRKNDVYQEDIEFFNHLSSHYQYYKKNQNLITNEIAKQYINYLLNYPSIQQEMKFFMDYQIGTKNDDVQKLINMEDSLFNSQKKDYENQTDIFQNNDQTKAEELSFSQF